MLSLAAQAELGLVKDVSAGICYSRPLGSFIQLYKDKETKLMMIVIDDPRWERSYYCHKSTRPKVLTKNVPADIDASPSFEEIKPPNPPRAEESLAHDSKDTPATIIEAQVVDDSDATIKVQLLTDPPGLAQPSEAAQLFQGEARTPGRSQSPDPDRSSFKGMHCPNATT